jgi:hypothetical protein
MKWWEDVKTKMKRKKMIENVAMQKAKQNYTEKTGKEMTASTMKMEAEGGMMSEDAKGYLKDKKMIGEDLKAKMKARKVY